MSENKKTNWKQIVIALVVLVILVGAAALVYAKFGPTTTEGKKKVTLEVIDDQGNKTTYKVKTEGKVLIDAIDAAKEKGLTYEGEDSVYGLTIYVINGIEADYNDGVAYWNFLINGEYCNYGVSEQPIQDGDVFTIEYKLISEAWQ